jgi:predicted DNA-binding protein (MmcQ/YjbR family)
MKARRAANAKLVAKIAAAKPKTKLSVAAPSPAKRTTRSARPAPAKRSASPRASASAATAKAALQKTALSYPGSWEDHPWGETVYKVGKKIFFFLGRGEGGGLSCTCKLPHSGEAALTMFGFCAPTGYGLGASGWVSATFARGEQVPLAMLTEWMDESYRAVAPAKLSRTLPAP